MSFVRAALAGTHPRGTPSGPISNARRRSSSFEWPLDRVARTGRSLRSTSHEKAFLEEIVDNFMPIVRHDPRSSARGGVAAAGTLHNYPPRQLLLHAETCLHRAGTKSSEQQMQRRRAVSRRTPGLLARSHRCGLVRATLGSASLRSSRARLPPVQSPRTSDKTMSDNLEAEVERVVRSQNDALVVESGTGCQCRHAGGCAHHQERWRLGAICIRSPSSSAGMR